MREQYEITLMRNGIQTRPALDEKKSLQLQSNVFRIYTNFGNDIDEPFSLIYLWRSTIKYRNYNRQDTLGHIKLVGYLTTDNYHSSLEIGNLFGPRPAITP